MTDWLGLVLQGVATVVEQWVGADAADRAAIEQRALAAIKDMVDARRATSLAHSERTAALLAEIEKAQAGS